MLWRQERDHEGGVVAEEAAQDEDCGVGVFLHLMEEIHWHLEYSHQINLPVKLGGWRVCFRTLYFTGKCLSAL